MYVYKNIIIYIFIYMIWHATLYRVSQYICVTAGNSITHAIYKQLVNKASPAPYVRI